MDFQIKQLQAKIDDNKKRLAPHQDENYSEHNSLYPSDSIKGSKAKG